MDKPKMSIAEIEAKMARGEMLEITTDGTAQTVDPQSHFDRLNNLYVEVAAERNRLNKELSALRAAFQWPYLNVTKLNELQMDSIRKVVPRLRQAHFTNLRVRINGEWEEIECDWLKHLVLPSDPPPSLVVPIYVSVPDNDQSEPEPEQEQGT